jgi:hypothetical protein
MHSKQDLRQDPAAVDLINVDAGQPIKLEEGLPRVEKYTAGDTDESVIICQSQSLRSRIVSTEAKSEVRTAYSFK